MLLVTVLVCLLLMPLTGACTIQQRAIMGQIRYSGAQVGQVIVTATRPGEKGITSSYGIGMNNIGSYNMLVRTGTYTVSAYMDSNYNNRQDPDEPFGYYDGNKDNKADEIVVKGEITDIDITLHDP